MRGLNPDIVHDLFSELNPDLFEEVFHAVMAGYVRNADGSPVSPMQERFLIDLHDFVIDTRGAPWKHEDKERRLVEILESLDEIDRRNTGQSPLPEDIGLRTEAAIDTNETAVVNRGVHETSRRKKDEVRPKYEPLFKWAGIRWDPLVRFIFAVYPRVKSVVDFTGEIRSRMQHAFLVDHVVIDMALKRKEELEFTPQELTALKFLLASTGTQVADARADISEVFGQELSATNPIDPAKVNYYDFANRAGKYQSANEYLRDQLAGEGDLDRAHTIINQARKRKGLEPRGVDDYAHDELRFRHMQYDREAGTTERRHGAALARPSSVNYDVHYEWEVHYKEYRNVTKTRRGEDGKGGTRTETYTEVEVVRTWVETIRGTVQRTPDYRSILRNDFDTSPGDTYVPERFAIGGRINGTEISSRTTGTSGLREIEKATELVRERETPYWDHLAASQKSLYDWVAEHQSIYAEKDAAERGDFIVGRLKEVTAARQELIQRRDQYLPYTKWGQTEVLSQWSHDVYSEFSARNDTLLARYQNLIKYYDIYEEQLRRGGDHGRQIVIEYRKPDYSEPLSVMHRRMVRDNWIKGILTMAGLVGGGYYYYQQSQNPSSQYQSPPSDDEESRREKGLPEISEEDFNLRDLELERWLEE